MRGAQQDAVDVQRVAIAFQIPPCPRRIIACIGQQLDVRSVSFGLPDQPGFAPEIMQKPATDFRLGHPRLVVEHNTRHFTRITNGKIIIAGQQIHQRRIDLGRCAVSGGIHYARHATINMARTALPGRNHHPGGRVVPHDPDRHGRTRCLVYCERCNAVLNASNKGNMGLQITVNAIT